MKPSRLLIKLSHHQKLCFLVLLMMIPFILGVLSPDAWWATHFISFLPVKWSIPICLGTPIFTIFLLRRAHLTARMGHYVSKVGNFPNFVVVIVSVAYAIVFYQFPIVQDYYGNARSFIPGLNQQINELSANFLAEMFRFKLEPGNGRHGVMQFYALVSYVSGLNLNQVFLWMGSLFGGAFIALWLYMVQRFVTHRAWKTCLALCGLTSPFLLIFFGHLDTYAPLYFLLLFWWLLYIRQARSGSISLLFGLVVLLLIGIRFHSLMYLMCPALGLLFLRQFGEASMIQQRLSNLKGLLLYIYLPICLLGLIGYFFILKDYNDPRTLENFTNMERLFLPLISPEPPLDKYNLLSWNHIFDFVNITFFWSSVSVFLSLVLLTFYIDRLRENRIETNAIILTLLLVVSFLFMFNPLMSMPMDWDLFVFPAPLLLVLLLLGFEKVVETGIESIFVVPALILGLLSIPTFVVTANRDMHSYRMESVGIHVYKSYYAHSSDYMLYGLQMIPNNPELYMQRKASLIDKLKPDAKLGRDPKFASLLLDNGYYKLKYMDRMIEAKRDFEAAVQYDPNSNKSWLYLMEANFAIQDFNSAFSNAEHLVLGAHPDRPTAIRFAIHCALEAELYDKALFYSNMFVQDHPENAFIQNIKARLENDDKVDELKTLFKTKE